MKNSKKIEKIAKEFIKVMEDIYFPKQDKYSKKSKTPCAKCLGHLCGCTIQSKRNTKSECNSFAEIGKNVIKYDDGTEKII